MFEEIPDDTREPRFRALGLFGHAVVRLQTIVVSVFTFGVLDHSWWPALPVIVAAILTTFNTMFYNGPEPRPVVFIVCLILESALAVGAFVATFTAFVLLFWVD